MAFTTTPAHIDEYRTLGYTVFRAIVPPALVADLRREADKGRLIARQRGGEQAQRLQPVRNYGLDTRPFLEFAALPEIASALQAVIGPEVYYGLKPDDPLGILGILYEPANCPWCMAWHRDVRDTHPQSLQASWARHRRDLDMFNQVNCALYEDACTWVVPGSHCRDDTAAERARFPSRVAAAPNIPGDLSVAATERCGLEYARSMPGAVQTLLNPGDFMVYHNSIWHMGNYQHYKPRATIHDVIGSPRYAAWVEESHRIMAQASPAKAAG